MTPELRDLVLSDKPIREYTMAELIDCLFEPVLVYVTVCDPEKHLHYRHPSRERDMSKKFYEFRCAVKEEIKRRTL